MARQALTIAGTIVGAAFGMPQLGFALGSMIGNAVDPVQIHGPKIGELQVQTSRDGVPRPIIFGVACVSGNIIDRSEPKIVKKKERQGKGGPEVVTERVYQSFAIRICEGEIQGISKIWENEKLIYDGGDTENFPIPDAGIGKFLGGVSALKGRIGASIYFGGEEQMPDPTFEAIHGVGNTPAYRGTAYIVFKDKDLTDFGGAIPQYRFEVNGPISTLTIGEVTHSKTLTGYMPGSDIYSHSALTIGVYESPTNGTSVGGTITRKQLRNDLTVAATETITHQAGGAGDNRLWFRTGDGFGQYLGADDSFGYCEVYEDGEYLGKLTPYAGAAPNWWYSEGSYSPEYGGLCWIHNNNIWQFVRQTSSLSNSLHFWNYIPVNDVGSNLATERLATSFSSVGNVYCHLDTYSGEDRFYVYDQAAGKLYEWDYSLNSLNHIKDIAMPSGMRGFAIFYGAMLTLYEESGSGYLRVSRLDTGETIKTVTGLVANSSNTKIICTRDSVYVKNGLSLQRLSVENS